MKDKYIPSRPLWDTRRDNEKWGVIWPSGIVEYVESREYAKTLALTYGARGILAPLCQGNNG
jgi:hypothetical protein